MNILKWAVLFTSLAYATNAQPGQPWKAYYDSTQLYWAKDWNKTVSLLENAEKSALADLGLYDENYLTILNDLGTAYWKAKKYPQAEQVLSKSLSLKREVYPEHDKEIILSLSNLAGFYADQGIWTKSKKYYNHILAHDPADIPSDIYVGAAQNLVSLYDLNQQPDSAALLLAKIDKWNIIPVNSFLAFQHKLYRARVHRKLQQYQEAEAELSRLVQALEKRPESELRELYVQCLQERGILFLQTGAYSRAESNLLQAYQMVTEEMKGDVLLTELSNNLAHVYDKLNIYDKALKYYEESLARCREKYDDTSLPCVILMNNIAGVHLKENNLPEAIRDYQNVIDQFERLLPASDPLYITALNNLATAYRKDGQLPRAKQYLDKATKLLEKSGLRNDDIAATVLNNMAVINTAEGEYENAALHYKRALDIKRSIYGDNSVLLMDLISNLAVTYWALNRPSEGIPLFKKSMDLALRQVSYVFPNLNENEQVQFYQKLKEDFERFNTIAIQWADRDGELVSQMFYNRTIIKSLQFFTHQRRNAYVARKNDPALNELVSRLKDCRDRLGHLYQLPVRDLKNAGTVSALEKEIDSLEKAVSLRSSEALHDEAPAGEHVHWRSLVGRLKADEAIIEMIRFRKYDRQSTRKKDYFGFTDSVHYAALILTPTTERQPELVFIREGNDLETRYYNYYKNAMRFKVQDNLSFRYFWQPFEKHLLGKKRVYFSADGVYHKINVNTLRDAASNAFLLDRFDIVYLLNPIQFLTKNPPIGQQRLDAVLMGDPMFDIDMDSPRERGADLNLFVGLPGTEGEIRAIDKVLKAHSWRTSIFMKGAATEANLKAVASPAILHLASHGFFSTDVVSLNEEAKKEFLFHSGIVLSGANKSLSTGSTSFHNDGIVTAFEVMNLDLTNTHLVVLSACETGLGKIENGEGVFGLQRSFMQAGARNVLISLWKVDDDATRDLMIAFYQYLARGNSLHESLRKAQADRAAVLADPALWGGFVLVGNN